MTKCAAQGLPNCTGVPGIKFIKKLSRAGFVSYGKTRGGYLEFRHTDGSVIWIRPNGEIVRLGPKIAGTTGKKYRPRFDQYGEKTHTHSTGEIVSF